jgi:hypothetical protein
MNDEVRSLTAAIEPDDRKMHEFCKVLEERAFPDFFAEASS